MSRPGNLSIKSSDGSVLLSRPGPIQINKQKSLLHQLRTACSFHYKGLELAKAGFGLLAVFCNALCKSTSKSAQPVF
jgi:hypothetical protein